jgi:hypothetical protein
MYGATSAESGRSAGARSGSGDADGKPNAAHGGGSVVVVRPFRRVTMMASGLPLVKCTW